MNKLSTPKPQGLVQQGKTHYLQLPIKNYTELAQMQIGLLQALQQLSQLENKTGNCLFWLSYLVEKSIFIENYEVLDAYLLKPAVD